MSKSILPYIYIGGMNMDYQKIYNNLIEKARNRDITDDYFEKHHIIPKSEGGSDDKSNIVNLTAREHFVAHLLLTHMENKRSRVNALWAMMREGKGQSRYYPSSRIYEWMKRERADVMSELQVGRKHIYNPHTLEKRFVKGDQLEVLLSKGWVLGSPNKTTLGKIGIHLPNTNIKKYIDKDELDYYLNEGWVKGLFKFKSSHSWSGKRKGKGNPTFGRVAVHNPKTKERYYIDKNEIKSYLERGFIKGRGPNKYD